MRVVGFSESSGGGTAGRAHVVVCGNEKGGCGKSTIAMHVATSLMKAGHAVATIDLDGRQLSLTRYVENRRRWAAAAAVDIALPRHFHVPPARQERVSEAEGEEFRQLTAALGAIERDAAFVVIDTPGADTYLSRMAHRLADTLVTPMNDSFVDFDVLGHIDPVSLEIVSLSHYALAVRDARRERRLADQGVLDWVVVRNRMAPISSRNERKMDDCLRRLSMQLGFRIADGIGERVIFRELFPMGLTALDELDGAPGLRPSISHLSARREVRQLVGALRLPVDEDGRARIERRGRHAELLARPIAMPDIFAV